MPPRHPLPRRQRGITLIESLVALLVAALGILGVVGVQMRTLADTQTGLRRAQAIRLIEDLSERTRVNPNALISISSYESGIDQEPSVTDCSSECDRSDLAEYDVAIWKQAVRNQLPGGKAALFIAPNEGANNARQLGVLIAWRENERADADSAYLDNIDTTKAAKPGGGFDDLLASVDASCPNDHTCHLQYIPVGARCSPYGSTSDPRFFCP